MKKINKVKRMIDTSAVLRRNARVRPVTGETWSHKFYRIGFWLVTFVLGIELVLIVMFIGRVS